MQFDFYKNQFASIEAQSSKLAFVGSDGELSWNEFYQSVSVLVSKIESLNLPEGYPLFIYGHKQLLFPISIVACLMTNHPFVPVDQLYPDKRIAEIMEETGSNVMIDCTGSVQKEELLALRWSRIENEFSLQGSLEQIKHDFQLPVYSTDPLSYVLFTSGSTGKPKGVLIRRTSILSLVDWILSGDFEMSSDDVFVNKSPFSFDVSLFDTFANLSYGASMIMVSQELSKDTAKFSDALLKYKATYWTSTPSFIYLYQREDWFNSHKIPSLKKFLFAGEPLSPSIVKLLHNQFEGSKVWNAYGPTEATVITTLLEVNPDILERYEFLPIGYSRPNGFFTTLPEKSTKDELGELVIVGKHVAEGYLNRPEQSKDRFYKEKGEKAYKTGDVGYVEEGMIFCLGRNDDQIKFNGYRLELEEINKKISSLAHVDEVKTIGLKRDGKVIRLVAMYQANEAFDNKEMKVQLMNKLPYYMVPSAFLKVDRFPLSASGKIDRNSLQDFYLREKKKK